MIYDTWGTWEKIHGHVTRPAVDNRNDPHGHIVTPRIVAGYDNVNKNEKEGTARMHRE